MVTIRLNPGDWKVALPAFMSTTVCGFLFLARAQCVFDQV
jgi:hypothetical protein